MKAENKIETRQKADPSNKTRRKKSFNLALQSIIELELSLNLGPQFTHRQLLKLLAKCNNIVKEQLSCLSDKKKAELISKANLIS